MRFYDLLKLSIRMFRARTSRTLLTILGMGVGISAILFLVSLGYGLQRTLLEKITTSEALSTLDVSENEEIKIPLNGSTIDEIRKIAGIGEVSPSFELASQGKVGDIVFDATALGITPSFLRLGGYSLIKGEYLNGENRSGVIVTSAVSKILGKENPEEILGSKIFFNFFLKDNSSSKQNLRKVEWPNEYYIIGIIESEEIYAYIDSETLKDLGVDRYNLVKIKVNSQASLEPVRSAILEKGFSVSSVSDLVNQANKVFQVVQVILMLFGIIALVVSAIGMFNTMTIALLERTEEIGIMKSIGASDIAISLMFIMESTIMGFAGGVGGVIIGISAGFSTNFLVNIIATKLGGQAVSLFYSPLWFIATIIVFGSMVGMITGFVPARRASKIDPLEALRYK